MPFCSKCGADITGVASCPQCGTAAGEQPAGAGTAPQTAPAAQSLPNNVAGALAYVTPIPAIIFLLIDPFKTIRFVRFHSLQSIRFVRFHSLQSIIFCVTAFVLQFALGIVSVALSFMGIPFIGLLSTLISIGIFVLWIVLVIKAYQGQEFQLPVISGLAAKWL